MRALILFLLPLSLWANCRNLAEAEALLNTRNFLQRSNEHIQRNAERRRQRLPPEAEERLQVSTIEQARNYALRFPAIRDLGFPPISANTWTPHIKRNVGGSAAGGLRDGWRISQNGRAAVVRLDWDPQKGMHYNIELEDAQRRTHKLSVEFNCNNRPCTERDYLNEMRRLNR